MPKFLSEDRIRLAVFRLRESRAQTRLNEFLVLKRGLVLSVPIPLKMSLTDKPWIQAVNDMMKSFPFEIEDTPTYVQPLVNVYGTARADDLGYRAKKYYSNGINFTRASWKGVVEVVSERPQTIKLSDNYTEILRDAMLLRQEDRSLPRLDDSAVWYYRSRDVSSLIPIEHSFPAVYAQALMLAYRSELDLTDDEVDILFDARTDANHDMPPTEEAKTFTAWTTISDEVASPLGYLPKPQVQLGTTAISATKLCSEDLVISLAAKGFTIYTGPSGTGKSRAGLELAQALSPQGQQSGESFALVPVGPDWTDGRALLGFRNPFGKPRPLLGQGDRMTNETYEVTPALRLLLRAAHPERAEIPHFLILDEMNLAHVERYFSAFLSLLEANRSVPVDQKLNLLDPAAVKLLSGVLADAEPDTLHTESAIRLASADNGLTFPDNLMIIGTVNVDETTYMFSPKVLDRAHVIELHSVQPEIYIRGDEQEEVGIQAVGAREILRSAIQRRRQVSLDTAPPYRQLPRVCAALQIDGPTDGTSSTPMADGIMLAVTRALDGAYTLLEPLGFGFGYRVVNEVFEYVTVWLSSMHQIKAGDPSFYEGWEDALDKAFIQKVLPKLHGNRRQFGDALIALRAFLEGNDRTSSTPARYKLGDAPEVGIASDAKLELQSDPQMPLSCGKLTRMQRRLVATGYVTFVE